MQLKSIILMLLLSALTTSTTIAQSTLKVFILAGQSNMEGHGEISPASVSGTLEHFLATDTSGEFDDLRDASGAFVSRSDVWVHYNRNGDELQSGNWGVGYGAWEGAIGPEYGFGYQLGNYFEEQVLIIKTAWGGKSLAINFRPPSAEGETGAYYEQMIMDIQSGIASFINDFSAYEEDDIEIVGFGWHQGWNDGEEDSYLEEYESNLINFISDVRNDLNAPNMQFVIGNTGHGGFELLPWDLWVYGLQTILVPAQENAANYEGHQGVGLADTRSFWRGFEDSPNDALHHWNENGESFLRIGNAMGEKMIELLEMEVTDVVSVSNSIDVISIFPSLAHNQLTIKGLSNTKSTISLLNSSGLIVQKNTTQQEQATVSLADLPLGLYFVRIQNEQGKQVKVQQIVKQ